MLTRLCHRERKTNSRTRRRRRRNGGKRKIKFDLCVSNYRYTPHARLRIIAMKRETFRQLLDLSLSLSQFGIKFNCDEFVIDSRWSLAIVSWDFFFSAWRAINFSMTWKSSFFAMFGKVWSRPFQSSTSWWWCLTSFWQLITFICCTNLPSSTPPTPWGHKRFFLFSGV